MLLAVNAIGNAEGLSFGEHCGSGIALFLRVVPVLMVARQIKGNLALLQLAFLNAENIRVRFPEKFRKALSHTGAKPVYIP